MDRRTWMQLMSVLSVARAVPGQQTPSAAPPPQVTKDQLAAALQLLGLSFPDDQMNMMLAGVNRARNGYRDLREISVPYETEPAFCFHPGLPGRKVSSEKPRFKPLRQVVPVSIPSDEDLAFLPVTQLAALVKARKVTSTQLTELYLGRLKKYGPALLCVITLTEELARKQASQADDEIARGHYRGPLHGIPWGAKDLFATKGIKTTWGAEPFVDQVLDYDAAVVERLANAGAVLLAKLSMGALAQGGLWFKGMTKTPWNIEKTSSGSSAGSASATAAGLVGFALGTETLGSIVSPCTACGAVGLRPTYGRVPRTGAMGLSWTMDKIGAICRGVEDCALVLNAIYGPDGLDRTVTSDPFHWEPQRPLQSLRIGVMQKAFDGLAAKEKEVLGAALDVIKKLGVEMKPVDADDQMGQRIRFLLQAEAAAAFDDITRDRQVEKLRGQAPGDWPNSFRTSRLVPAVEYIRAQRVRTLLVEKMEKWLADFDVIVTPPFRLLTTTNLTGHPQVVVPCGFVDGLPRTIGFLGRLYDEGSPLRLALAYQQATDWHTKRPPLKVTTGQQ